MNTAVSLERPRDLTKPAQSQRIVCSLKRALSWSSVIWSARPIWYRFRNTTRYRKKPWYVFVTGTRHLVRSINTATVTWMFRAHPLNIQGSSSRNGGRRRRRRRLRCRACPVAEIRLDDDDAWEGTVRGSSRTGKRGGTGGGNVRDGTAGRL